MTLVELMVVIVIAAIMATIAAPSFSNFIRDTRLTSTMTQLTGDLNRARSEAIKRNSRVLVCAHAINDTIHCANTTWNNGWLICYDRDTVLGDGVPNGQCDDSTSTNPNPIVVRQAITSPLALTGKVTGTTTTVATVRFNANGTANTATTLELCCKSAAPVISSASIAVTGHISKL